MPTGKGNIAAVQAVIGELGCQSMVGCIAFCHHQQAAGVFVDAVHDARPADAANARKTVAAMVQQGVYKGTIGGAGGRMHHHAGGLVHHDQGVIFIGDDKGNVLAFRFGGLGGGNVKANMVPRFDGCGGVPYRLVVDCGMSGFDQAFTRDRDRS